MASFILRKHSSELIPRCASVASWNDFENDSVYRLEAMADDHFPNMLLPVQLMEVRDTRNFGDIGKVLSQSEHEVVPIARSVPQGNRINTI